MEIVQTMNSDPGLAVGETRGGAKPCRAAWGAGPEGGGAGGARGRRSGRTGAGLDSGKAEPGYVVWTLGLGVLYSEGADSFGDASGSR